MKAWLKTPVIALAAMLATPAHADITCDFTIPILSLSPDGWVYITLSSGGSTHNWWFCPVSGSTVVNDGYSNSRTITSDSCKAIYSELLTAKAANKQIRFNYHGPTDCSAASLPPDGTPTLFPSLIQLLQ